MSGFETIAALIGVADVSVRSISALYNAIQDIRSAPKEIESLAAELHVLQQCLFQLRFLEKADSNTRAATRDFGLPTAIRLCGEACAALHRHLPEPKSNRSLTLHSRIRFYFSKTEIRNVLENINSAKQTTILTVVTTQLFFQLENQSSPQKKLDLIIGCEEEVKALRLSNKSTKAKHEMADSSRIKEVRTGKLPWSEDDDDDANMAVCRAPNTDNNPPNADTTNQGFTRYVYEKVLHRLASLKDTIKESFAEIEASGEGHKLGVKSDPTKSQDIVVDFKGKITTMPDSKNITFGVH